MKRLIFVISLTVVQLIFLSSLTEGLQCNSCSTTANFEDCSTTIGCDTSESCYLNIQVDASTINDIIWTFTAGCKSTGLCTSFNISTCFDDLTIARNPSCEFCCNYDRCNDYLSTEPPTTDRVMMSSKLWNSAILSTTTPMASTVADTMTSPQENSAFVSVNSKIVSPTRCAALCSSRETCSSFLYAKSCQKCVLIIDRN
ncbi:hypothetical protein BSL78_13193 [Apostichopus japonicus]|uniref:Apple domain-containing protein n=1 Tax=Stichopus japonicus TaxID=307972 RepID=A0A2G8KPI2_STIJA|nr:hypothetical protein BSL78_13193 [Apostichopus japonicus]